jgi:purine-binding chemotaxis protein CheW
VIFQVCLFQIGSIDFALRLECVREIVPMATLSRPPATPPLLEGFLNLGGAAVPVLRLGPLLGLAPEPIERHTPLIVARLRSQELALLVSRVTAVAAVDADGITRISESESFNGCVEAGVTAGGRTAHLLSGDRLVLERERAAIDAFQAIETRRLRETTREAS